MDFLRTLTLVITLFVISGCAASIESVGATDPVIGHESATHRALAELPPPLSQLIVAVYKFRDQTGQYKPGPDFGPGWSTAVTQGATSMLIKALQDAGRGRWFKVLERESLTNLLNERKIIRQTRRQYLTNKDRDKMPRLNPLLYAPVLFDGGVIAYETNLLTGGIGARYFGLGGDTQYRRNSVTVYLRAVSVKTGEILKSVLIKKTIYSFEINVGIFRFLSFKRLLEAEAGFTTNEPTQMAVLQAIEKAVYAMIMEGALSRVWTFRDGTAGRKLVQQYVAETNEQTNFSSGKPLPRLSGSAPK